MSRRFLAKGLPWGLVVALGFAAAPLGLMGAAGAVEPPNTDSDHVYIVDYNTGSVLFDKAGEERLRRYS